MTKIKGIMRVTVHSRGVGIIGNSKLYNAIYFLSVWNFVLDGIAASIVKVIKDVLILT